MRVHPEQSQRRTPHLKRHREDSLRGGDWPIKSLKMETVFISANERVAEAVLIRSISESGWTVPALMPMTESSTTE